MALFLNLTLGHLMGDFLLQPGRLVIAKRDGAPGLIIHTLVIGACTLAVLAGTIAVDWTAAVFVTVMHLVIERLTIVTYLKTPTRGLYTLMLDQAMHALSIALVVWLVGQWRPSATAVTFGMHISTRLLAQTVGVLTASLFGSILVFEVVNAFMGGSDSKGRVLRLDAPRIGGFLERGTALVLATAWHPAALAVPFIPRLVYAIGRQGEDRKRLLVEAAAGAALCALVLLGVEIVTRTAGGTLPDQLGSAGVTILAVLKMLVS